MVRGQVPRIVTEIPGPRSRALFTEEQRYIAPGLQQIALLSRIVLDRGEGATVTDVDGNTFIDFFAGVSVASLGHGHPEYAKAISEQVAKISVGSFTTEPRARLLRKIAEIAPGDLTRTQFYSGGSEAVEAALRLAKSHTKKHEVVGFWGGFHGKTQGVVGLGGQSLRNSLGPIPSASYNVPYADCYHCSFKATFPSCGFLCVEFAREAIKSQTAGRVAALLVEPVQGTAGNVVPPPGYLQHLKEVAREAEALLIFDEIITGFGRTGKMFASEYDGVVPDIMTAGKGMGGGFPVSAVISTDEITAAEPAALPSASSSSFGGNPLAARAMLATVETIIRERLHERAAQVGARMLELLHPFEERYRFVGQVRGRGLLVGIELVRDKKSREPLPRLITERIFHEALKRGLILMGYGSRIRINPPLVITQEVAERGIEILADVFDHVANTVEI